MVERQEDLGVNEHSSLPVLRLYWLLDTWGKIGEKEKL